VKFKNEQKKKPRGERKKLPEPPKNFDDMAIGVSDTARDQYNEEAMKEWNDKALDKCEGCGRTFNPESLPKHQKGCAGMKGKAPKASGGSSDGFGGGSSGGFGGSAKGGGFGSPKKKGGRKAASPPRMPVALICHICG